MISLEKSYLPVMFLWFAFFISGCLPEEQAKVPLLDIQPETVSLSKNNQRDTLELRNSGDDMLYWNVRNKPDWIIMSQLSGEIASGEAIMLPLIGDLALGQGEYADTIQFRSVGGDHKIPVALTIDVAIPENDSYFGNTSEGLDISFVVEYDRIKDFHGHYFLNAKLRVENLPIFGIITYSDNNLTSEGSHGSELIGVFDGLNTISGTWRLRVDHEVQFSVTRYSTGS